MTKANFKAQYIWPVSCKDFVLNLDSDKTYLVLLVESIVTDLWSHMSVFQVVHVPSLAVRGAITQPQTWLYDCRVRKLLLLGCCSITEQPLDGAYVSQFNVVQ